MTYDPQVSTSTDQTTSTTMTPNARRFRQRRGDQSIELTTKRIILMVVATVIVGVLAFFAFQELEQSKGDSGISGDESDDKLTSTSATTTTTPRHCTEHESSSTCTDDNHTTSHTTVSTYVRPTPEPYDKAFQEWVNISIGNTPSDCFNDIRTIVGNALRKQLDAHKLTNKEQSAKKQLGFQSLAYQEAGVAVADDYNGEYESYINIVESSITRQNFKLAPQNRTLILQGKTQKCIVVFYNTKVTKNNSKFLYGLFASKLKKNGKYDMVHLKYDHDITDIRLGKFEYSHVQKILVNHALEAFLPRTS